MVASTLNIFNDLQFDTSITKHEYHVYQPTTHNYKNCDEIRILIQHQDILTVPSESFLRIHYTSKFPAKSAYQRANNGVAFLFEEIRYELNGVEIERAKDVGMSSLMKGLISLSKSDVQVLEPAGWYDTLRPEQVSATEDKIESRVAQIPLSLLLGFAEDYKKFITHIKQELILIRSRTDKDYAKSSDDFTIDINKIEWFVPRIEVSDEFKLQLYEKIKRDPSIFIPFRRMELHELPSLRQTDHDTWNVKTSSALERPRYVILAFQTNRRDLTLQHADRFDHCNLRNVKVYLNSECYPYTHLNLNIENNDYALLYYMYTQFQVGYYNKSPRGDPLLTFEKFKENMIFVFDVSKQNEAIKSESIDLKIELEGKEVFKAGTRAYCLIIGDCIIEYKPISGLVRKVVQ